MKVKYELNKGLGMVNLHVKLKVHSCNGEQNVTQNDLMASIHSKRYHGYVIPICMVFGVASSFVVSVLSSKVIFNVKGHFQSHNNRTLDCRLVLFCVLT